MGGDELDHELHDGAGRAIVARVGHGMAYSEHDGGGGGAVGGRQALDRRPGELDLATERVARGAVPLPVERRGGGAVPLGELDLHRVAERLQPREPLLRRAAAHRRRGGLRGGARRRPAAEHHHAAHGEVCEANEVEDAVHRRSI